MILRYSEYFATAREGEKSKRSKIEKEKKFRKTSVENE
jgi:hypothetical protein